MPEPVLRLRSERRRRARRSSPWRWPAVLIVGTGALVWGAACWAPVAPAPLNPVAPTLEPARAAPTLARAATPAAAAPTAPGPTPTPVRLAPVPSLAPTLTAGGQSLLASLRADLSAQWLKNHAETTLRAGPSDDTQAFTTLPQWTLLKQLDARADWLEVYYSGDGDTRQPGPGWVHASDVGGVDAPSVWLATSQSTTLFSGPDASSPPRLDLPSATSLEVQALATGGGTRVKVRLPGDGRQVPPAEGWVDAGAVARAASPGVLPWAYPAVLSASVRMEVPYRTQLDGSPYASANCGPTVLGMVLEAFGRNIEPPGVRDQVLDAEGFPRWDDDAGSYIWALARVAEANGIHTYGLYDDTTEQQYHRWTTDEIRESVAQGRPVVVQVIYRGLPGRADSAYPGDHYIVVTGLLGDQFLYNDPIGGPIEGPGWDRVMSPAQLQRAMNASDRPYAHTAFAVARS